MARFRDEIFAPYTGPDLSRSLCQLVGTTLLFAGTWVLMLRSLTVSYWLTLLLAIPAAGFLVRLFIIQHDCGHGSFFRSAAANNALGFVLGVLCLTPYQYWRRTHAIHHATAGDLDRREFGDIETLTVNEYLASSAWGRLRYRLYRNPFVLLILGPIYLFFLKHRFPFDTPRSWKKEWASVAWTNLALVVLLVLAWKTIGLDRFLLVQMPISFVGGIAGVAVFYVHHQFEDTYWSRHEDWDFHRAGIEGSSFFDLPRILHWFTGNIGYHHVHHLSSRIPNYRLRECFEASPELQHVTRLNVSQSLQCFRLKLWDEDQHRLIGFRALRVHDSPL